MKKTTIRIAFFVVLLLILAILFFFKKSLFFKEDSFVNNDYTTIIKPDTETCLQCHTDTQGFSKHHNPNLIGCASCHLGNTKTLDKEKSHQGMVLIPGNLSDAKETCGVCHPDELTKIDTSLMTTNSGLVAVDKYIFGEANSPDIHYHIKDIKKSPSDKHLRDLCANCHLGAEKNEFGAITQLSRGGGCNACHLNYSKEAKKDLSNYITSDKTKLPATHPSTDIFMSNTHCFGCHSRSSRISSNYEGWQETLFKKEEIKDKTGYRVFEDERVYIYKGEDVHHTKGLLCIDCHSSHEVMGDGIRYLHEEEAVSLECSDCHFKDKPTTVSYDSLDKESLLVYLHRDYTHADKSILAVKKDKHPLINTYITNAGKAFLIGKKDGVLHEIKPQSEICSRDTAHKNMSCATCHASWTPRCIGCHNQFDKNEAKAFDLLDREYGTGQWKEYVAEFSSSLPAMGVRENKDGRRIEPAMPGMILTIDKGSYSDKKIEDLVSFHRLYAPNSPHTTAKKARDCKSCHTDAATLGYGRGKLEYNIENGPGKWVFIPEYENNPHDDLPEDAWIPFLSEVKEGVINSTRSDFRPFSVAEQKRILLVGACLQCHQENSEIMQQSLVNGINPLLKKLSKNCLLPSWD